MRDIKGSSSFVKRVNFISSILHRNENSKLRYKTKHSLIYKQEEEPLKKEINYITNESFNSFSNNITTLNRYMNNNSLNIFSIKNLLTNKNFYNRFTSAIKTYEKNSFIDNEFKSFKKDLNKHNLEVSNQKEFHIKRAYQNKEFSFDKNSYIENTTNKMRKKELIFQNSTKNFIYKKTEDKEQNEKELEKRVIKQLEEKIDEKIFSKKSSEINIQTINTNYIVTQREEKALTNRIYESVIKKWDKENRRRGYLYE